MGDYFLGFQFNAKRWLNLGNERLKATKVDPNLPIHTMCIGIILHAKHFPKLPNLGASLTKYTGAWEFAAILSARWSDYDTLRAGGIIGMLPGGGVVDTVGVSAIKHKMNHQNLRLSFAYDRRGDDIASRVAVNALTTSGVFQPWFRGGCVRFPA